VVNPGRRNCGHGEHSGDPLVQMIAGAYVAPFWRWKRLLGKPITPGRPRKDT
jgi:hypothetical protein